MKMKIMFSSIIILLVSLFAYFSTGFRGYYYKTNIRIGDEQVYDYKVISLSRYCKGFEIVKLYADHDYEYYVIYKCDGSGNFIRHNGDYLRLDEALELNLITIDEIKEANIMQKQEIQRYTFQAKVLDNDGQTFMVEPNLGTYEINSSDKIIISITNTLIIDSNGNEIDIRDIQVNDQVEIIFNGLIAESYPAQIHRCFQIKLLK
ncbi:MAG: hypothetical protein K0Q49_345 [Haloplasmataceae bacterium]|jgi:hypothetical protein|nr:hypothetical protein [Haloplasmataceae bacterium]